MFLYFYNLTIYMQNVKLKILTKGDIFMEIIVKGEAEKNFKPNLIKINFEFRVKAIDYDKVLENGVKDVENYINLLQKFGFNKQDIKTRNLRITEDSVYDNELKKYVKVGYVFNQNLNLEFDYDIKRMSSIMEETSKLKNAPTYHVNFAIKEDKKVEEELLALAYKDAEFQANAIAKASNKTLKSCAKVSFQPFESSLTSQTNYGLAKMAYNDGIAKSSASETIQKIFVPEDVVADMELYTIWIAD